MLFYALSLCRASFLMANSSWTKARIDSILRYGNDFFNTLHYLSPLVFFRSSFVPKPVVYPPCANALKFVDPLLEGRRRVIVSLAPLLSESNHRPQLLALSILLKSHPEYCNPRVAMIFISRSGDANPAGLKLKELRETLGLEVGRIQTVLF